MKQSRFSDSQIIAALKQAEGGSPVPELCREHGISSATFYKWRSKHADGVTAKVNSLPRPHKHKCHTVTLDNGKEFAEHETIAAELKTDIFFAHPYHSSERGLNENSNGLLRQCFPKGTDLTGVAEEQVQWAVERLNHRPRKVLEFRTPFEVFSGETVRYTKPPLNVALRN